jgi:hypothetical protein
MADPGLGLGLLDLNHACILDLVARIDELTFEDARHRLAQVLLEQEDIAFDEVRPSLSRHELAEVVGVSNEMTGRILRELEDAGAVRRLNHLGLQLVDRAYLEALAGVAGCDPDACPVASMSTDGQDRDRSPIRESRNPPPAAEPVVVARTVSSR